MADDQEARGLAGVWRRLTGLGKARRGDKVPIPTSLVQQATVAGGNPTNAQNRFQIEGAGAGAWFGPWQPIMPMAPGIVAGRQFDYTTGLNINYIPRGDSPVTFEMLRSLADNLPLLRIVIEKRKDQIAGWNWDIQPKRIAKDKRKRKTVAPDKEDPDVAAVEAFLAMPDRRHSFHLWLRMLLEDMLVVDAACLYPRTTKGGKLYSLDVVDGSTIKQLIGEDGRPPLPEDGPAYQQILHGVPAADFTLDELLYLPRNLRSNRLYGYSPVEQVILTVNIALRREVFNLEYYNAGTLPEGFASMPKEWTTDQISQFQAYFDTLLGGNLADRRKLHFMPSEFKYSEVRQPPLKDMYDEWLARIICAAFSVPPNPFVVEGGRVTAQTLQVMANQEGIVPLKNWIKDAIDGVIQIYLGKPNLEFIWSGGDELDPLEKAQETQILVACGVKTRDEARDEYGLDAVGVGLTTDNPVIPLVEGYRAAVDAINNPASPLSPHLIPTPPKPSPAPAAPDRVGATPGATRAATGTPRARPKKPVIASQPAARKPPKAPAHKNPTKTSARDARKAAGGGESTDSSPLRTLYVRREVKNADDLAAWAKQNGFSTTLTPEDMHTTVAFSRMAVDWDEMPPSAVPEVIVGGGNRSIARLGDAIVLIFESPELSWRAQELQEAGASWDHPQYIPHVTLSYNADGLDLGSVVPYAGELDFGPEIWEEVQEDWHDGIEEKAVRRQRRPLRKGEANCRCPGRMTATCKTENCPRRPAAEVGEPAGAPFWKETDPLSIVNAAGVILRTKSGNVLFLERAERAGDNGGVWAFPGGGIKDGETPEQAAVRECLEEIGASIDEESLTPEYTSANGYQTFSCDVPEEFTPTLNHEHSAHVWAPPSHPPEPLHPGVREMLLATGMMTGFEGKMAKASEVPSETLSDTEPPPPDKKSWGFHLLVDMSGCNGSMDDEDAVREFFATLIEKIEMKILSPIMIERVEGEEGRGLSAVQMITTSSITFHADDDKMCIYLDIFSCKDFDVDDALDLIEDTFDPKAIAYRLIYRDAG
jgi:8-oxo-dGTP pyrophosphatase MutT (NUDIX family)/S-adenosylmethionine/arginine decarboxylase-like enzyme